VQEVRWEGGGTELVGEYTFFYVKGNENYELGTGFFVHKIIISAVKWVEFVSDRMSYIILGGRWCHIVVLNAHAPTEDKTNNRMSYIILGGRWCHIIVLNAHAPTEDKTNNVKGSFYEELERVFDKFPKHTYDNYVRRFQC
jgi:hypothetical protein